MVMLPLKWESLPQNLKYVLHKENSSHMEMV